jgi:hypothetical protein
MMTVTDNLTGRFRQPAIAKGDVAGDLERAMGLSASERAPQWLMPAHAVGR